MKIGCPWHPQFGWLIIIFPLRWPCRRYAKFSDKPFFISMSVNQTKQFSQGQCPQKRSSLRICCTTPRNGCGSAVQRHRLGGRKSLFTHEVRPALKTMNAHWNRCSFKLWVELPTKCQTLQAARQGHLLKAFTKL